MHRCRTTLAVAVGLLAGSYGPWAIGAQDAESLPIVTPPMHGSRPLAEALPGVPSTPIEPSPPVLLNDAEYLPYRFEYGHSQPTAVTAMPANRHGCGAGCQNCNPPKLGSQCKAELQYSHWGYPEEFQERPFGSIVRAQSQQQVVNGIAALSALYRYDFFPPNDPNAEKLTSRGKWQLRKIASHILTHSVKVMVESTGDAQLDAARQQHVFDQLAQFSVPVPAEQIVIGTPRPSGLQGLEALTIYQNQLIDTRAKGAFSGGGGGGGGNFGASPITGVNASP